MLLHPTFLSQYREFSYFFLNAIILLALFREKRGKAVGLLLVIGKSSMNTTTSAATLRQSEGIPVGTTDRLSRTGSAGGAGYATKR